MIYSRTPPTQSGQESEADEPVQTPMTDYWFAQHDAAFPQPTRTSDGREE